MGYSERKKEIIDELVKNKKAADKKLALANTQKAVSQTALDTINGHAASNKTDLDNAKNDLEASHLASHNALTLKTDVEDSRIKADTLLADVEKMVKWAHLTASKTAALALKLEEFNTYIIKESNHKNSVISSWLLKDAAQAVVNAKAAVTATAKALVDSITAQGLVISLANSLTDTEKLITATLPHFNDKKNGLDVQLEKLYAESKDIYETSMEHKKEMERELLKATLEHNKFTIDATAKQNALDAAVLAVASN
jgi:hypothetical protein